MKPVHQVLAVGGFLLLGAVSWWILTLPRPQSRWLTVEAPASVAPGETITLRISVSAPDPNLHLIADLHGWSRRNHPLRAVSHAKPQRLSATFQSADFSLPVPALPDLAVVRAIIYLSPTGNWSDHVRVATSAEIPVKSVAGPPAPGLEPLRMHELVPDPVIPRLESVFLRRLIVGLWLIVAIALGLLARRSRPESAAAPGPKTATLVRGLIVACLVVMLTEILGVEPRIGDFVRQFALRHDLYERRQLVQQVAVLLTVVGMAAVFVVIIVRARRRRLVCSLLAHAAISITAMISLHETDTLLYATVLGLPVEQLAKLVAVGLAFWGLRSPPAPP